jgi:hypothetical protein
VVLTVLVSVGLALAPFFPTPLLTLVAAAAVAHSLRRVSYQNRIRAIEPPPRLVSGGPGKGTGQLCHSGTRCRARRLP